MISQRLRSYIFGHRWEYLKGFALGVIATGVALIAPSVLRRAVDGIRGGISSQALLGLAATYVALALAAATIRFFWRTNVIGASPRIEYEMRNDYFAHLQRLPLGFFQHTRTGDLMARAINDLNAVQRLAGPGIMYAINTPVMLLLVGGWGAGRAGPRWAGWTRSSTPARPAPTTPTRIGCGRSAARSSFAPSPSPTTGNRCCTTSTC